MNKILGHRHTGIVCNDIGLQKDFYCNHLGLQIISEELEQGEFFENITKQKSALIVKMGHWGSVIIELLKFLNINDDYSRSIKKKSINDFGFTHIALTVLNLDKLYLDLKNKGIKFVSEPLINPQGTAKVCFCYDPEDNLIELVQELK